MWLVRHQFGNVTQIELCPDEHHDPLKESRRDKVAQGATHGDGFNYRVPLGSPIVDLNIFELQKDSRKFAVEALSKAVHIEQTNLTFRHLGVHIASWFDNVKPNDPTSLANPGGSVFWNGNPGQNVPVQIGSLKNIALTLALNLNEQGDHEKLSHLAPVFQLFNKDAIPEWILNKLPAVALGNLG